MKKNIYRMMAAMMLTTGALMQTGCSGQEDGPDEPMTPPGGVMRPATGIPFSATMAPRGTATRAITTGKDAEGREILKVQWKKGEQIAIYYEKDDGTFAMDTATVDAVDGEGAATVSTILYGAKDGAKARFLYPAKLANDTCGIDMDKLQTGQTGQLHTGITNISKHFDAATATAPISVDNGQASLSATLEMQSQVCIMKLNLNFDDGKPYNSNEPPLQGGKILTISVGDGKGYTISSHFEEELAVSGTEAEYRPFQTGDAIYVAMLPVNTQDIYFKSGKYGMMSNDVTLQAGQFYRDVDVTMSKYNIDLSEIKDMQEKVYNAEDGDIIRQSGYEMIRMQIDIPDGATVTISNINIEGQPGIRCEGDATIILEGENSIRGIASPGIRPGEKGKRLTIKGSGRLSVWGAEGNSGIGPTPGGICGNIIIEGGIIEAWGSDYPQPNGRNAASPAIGAGDSGECGNIEITNGVTKLIAHGSPSAKYSIGLTADKDRCGTITIGGITYYDGEKFINGGQEYLARKPLIYEPTK